MGCLLRWYCKKKKKEREAKNPLKKGIDYPDDSLYPIDMKIAPFPGAAYYPRPKVVEKKGSEVAVDGK